MHQDTQIEIIRRILDHLDRAEPSRSDSLWSVPASIYTSVDELALEQRTILSTSPQLIALSSDLPEPSSYVVRDSTGASVVLTRDAAGAVHAFANVCRHRGSRVAEDRGTTLRLVCPYHAWSYSMDGSLWRIPDSESFPGIEPGSCALPELPCVEVAGTIWMIPRSAEELTEADVRASLGTYADDFAALDIPYYVHWRQHRFDLEFNWKLLIDTFFEPYHFPVLHRNTVGPIFVSNLCDAHREGHHVREVLPRKTIAKLSEQPETEWDLIRQSAIVYFMFPNTVLVVQVDHLETWRIRPVDGDPGRCVCELDFYIPPNTMDDRALNHWQRNWDLTINTVIEEDFRTMAGAQGNLASGALERLTFGRNEPALALLHRAIAEALDQERAKEATSLGGTSVSVAATASRGARR
jgi:phenylpropionate dioxygenase-like ring-hydroxylating dioxygenase large terminal subunit